MIYIGSRTGLQVIQTSEKKSGDSKKYVIISGISLPTCSIHPEQSVGIPRKITYNQGFGVILSIIFFLFLSKFGRIFDLKIGLKHSFPKSTRDKW